MNYDPTFLAKKKKNQKYIARCCFMLWLAAELLASGATYILDHIKNLLIVSCAVSDSVELGGSDRWWCIPTYSSREGSPEPVTSEGPGSVWCSPCSVGFLLPMQALFIDNWRVLHGREAFTGYRQLCGCYLTRDDVLNTARLLGLQA